MKPDAIELMEQAKAFVQANPDIYEHLLKWARARAAGFLPLTAERMSLEVEDMAYLKHGSGRNKSFPHALRAPILRMLMRDAPEIRAVARISPSKVDGAFDFIDFDKSKASARALATNRSGEGRKCQNTGS